mgnify:CR=1 FL=1
MNYWNNVGKGFKVLIGKILALILVFLLIILIVLTAYGISWLAILNFHIAWKIVVVLASVVALFLLVRGFLNFLARMGKEQGNTLSLNRNRFQNKCPIKQKDRKFLPR